MNIKLAKESCEEHHKKAQAKSIEDFPSTKQRIQNSKTKIKKEKKKNQHNENCIRDQKTQKGLISATRINASVPGEQSSKKKKNKNQTCLNRMAYDLNQVKYYNCQNLSYYVSICPRLSKNLLQSWRLSHQ